LTFDQHGLTADTSAPVRFFEFPGLEAVFAAGGLAMRNLYQLRALRILEETWQW
jgi:hypothetical protein